MNGRGPVRAETPTRREVEKPPAAWLIGKRLRGCRGGQFFAALGHGAEEFVAFAEAADANVLVFQHRFDDAQNRFRTKIILAVEPLDGFENLFLAQAWIFESGLLD